MSPLDDVCACGCGETATIRVMLLREQDRSTAAALRWAELSVAPMRVRVRVVEGHEDAVAGYVYPEGGAR